MAIKFELLSVGLESYFVISEPFYSYIYNNYRIDTSKEKLKIASIFNMKDLLINNFLDPYNDIYVKVGLGLDIYETHLALNIPIVTFTTKNSENKDIYIRIPGYYIEDYRTIEDIEYMNKYLVLDFGYLPLSEDLSVFFDDIKEFFKTITGVTPDIKELNIGEPTFINREEHGVLETARKNNITFKKPYRLQYEELSLKYNELINRLDQLGIVLGE